MKNTLCLWILFLLTVASAEAARQQRSFYLTQSNFTGGQALAACADGYHMASLWEIFDISNLRYDTSLGFTRDDSGSGPPASAIGWVRTGVDDEGTGFAGVANCHSWTSSQVSDSGTVIQLNSIWESSPFRVTDPWSAFTLNCIYGNKVWCVQD